jgi:hypothetical protein
MHCQVLMAALCSVNGSEYEERKTEELRRRAVAAEQEAKRRAEAEMLRRAVCLTGTYSDHYFTCVKSVLSYRQVQQPNKQTAQVHVCLTAVAV